LVECRCWLVALFQTGLTGSTGSTGST
jgi:hypothetical protein